MSDAVALVLREKAEELVSHGGYHRLLLLVGPARSGKTGALRDLVELTGWPKVNLNLALSERLLDVPSRFREIRVLDLVREIAAASPGDGLVVDNIELLFQRTLQQDPLQLLFALSRNRVVVSSWSGSFAGGVLTYAAPGHPEYRHYPQPDCAILPVSPT